MAKKARVKLRELTYKRHGFRCRPQTRKGNLLWLVFDIPYLDACGVFPPFHILNQIFLSGGGDGGMSPGASWKPFSITEDEYTVLADAIVNTPKAELKPHSLYATWPLTNDHSFGDIQDRMEWVRAVCAKHRDSCRRPRVGRGPPKARG